MQILPTIAVQPVEGEATVVAADWVEAGGAFHLRPVLWSCVDAREETEGKAEQEIGGLHLVYRRWFLEFE